MAEGRAPRPSRRASPEDRVTPAALVRGLPACRMVSPSPATEGKVSCAVVLATTGESGPLVGRGMQVLFALLSGHFAGKGRGWVTGSPQLRHLKPKQTK